MAFVCRTAASVEVRLTFRLTVCRVAYHRLGPRSMEYMVCPKSGLDSGGYIYCMSGRSAPDDAQRGLSSVARVSLQLAETAQTGSCHDHIRQRSLHVHVASQSHTPFLTLPCNRYHTISHVFRLTIHQIGETLTNRKDQTKPPPSALALRRTSITKHIPTLRLAPTSPRRRKPQTHPRFPKQAAKRSLTTLGTTRNTSRRAQARQRWQQPALAQRQRTKHRGALEGDAEHAQRGGTDRSELHARFRGKPRQSAGRAARCAGSACLGLGAWE